jgi:leucine carboxyl methyltransferase
VLHVGCGMDSRFFRVDPPASVQWFDVDYPDVIGLRLLPRTGCRSDDRCTTEEFALVGRGSTGSAWGTSRRRGAALPERNGGESAPQCGGRSLLQQQMIFDIGNPWIVKRAVSNVGGTSATYKWGLDDSQDIKQLEPKLERIAFSRSPLW